MTGPLNKRSAGIILPVLDQSVGNLVSSPDEKHVPSYVVFFLADGQKK